MGARHGLTRPIGLTTGAEEEADILWLMGELPTYIASGFEGARRTGLVHWLTVTARWPEAYAERIAAKAQKRLASIEASSRDDVRQRILLMVEAMLPRCRTYVRGTAPSEVGIGGGGTIIMDDPDGGPLMEIDHTAVQGYLRIAMSLHGLGTKNDEPLAKPGERPHVQMTDEDLQREIERLASERQATPT